MGRFVSNEIHRVQMDLAESYIILPVLRDIFSSRWSARGFKVNRVYPLAHIYTLTFY